MLNKIFLGNAYKLMESIPDNSIDLIITDPPYSIQPRGGGIRKKRDYMDVIYQNGMADGYTNEMLQQFIRVMKKVNIYIFASKNQLHQIFSFFQGYNVDLLIWHKLNPIPTINNKYLSDIEYIVFARDKGVKLYNSFETSSKLFQTAVNKSDADEYDHPTVKPYKIIESLLLNSSLPGQIILDPFSGTGTTALAAKRNQRNFIAFEINPKYYKTSVMRLNGYNFEDQLKKENGFQNIFDYLEVQT